MAEKTIGVWLVHEKLWWAQVKISARTKLRFLRSENQAFYSHKITNHRKFLGKKTNRVQELTSFSMLKTEA